MQSTAARAAGAPNALKVVLLLEPQPHALSQALRRAVSLRPAFRNPPTPARVAQSRLRGARRTAPRAHSSPSEAPALHPPCCACSAEYGVWYAAAGAGAAAEAVSGASPVASVAPTIAAARTGHRRCLGGKWLTSGVILAHPHCSAWGLALVGRARGDRILSPLAAPRGAPAPVLRGALRPRSLTSRGAPLSRASPRRACRGEHAASPQSGWCFQGPRAEALGA